MPLEDDELTARVALAQEHGIRPAARQLGIDPSTLRSSLKTAAKRGLMGTKPVLPGFGISKISTTLDADGNTVREHIQQRPDLDKSPFNMPEGHTLKGVSAYLDSDGNVIGQWVKTKEGERSPEETAEIIKAAFEKWEPSAPYVLSPRDCDTELLTLFPLADLHLGLYAWKGEAGGNWDLQTAVTKYRETMAQVAACAPPSGVAVVLGGGDYLHANTNDFRTNSGNVLDGDGRTDKVIDAAIDLAVFQINLALQKHGSVIVRFLKGNHDEYASIAIVHALAAWYRNEPRITVDKDPSLYWWHRYGKVLLGASHGHNVKITEMPLIMANRVPVDWGETEHRFIHTFHVHHKTQHVFEHGGVLAESHQSPVVQDAYHFGKGYLSGRSMQSITYHRERGEIVRNRVVLG